MIKEINKDNTINISLDLYKSFKSVQQLESESCRLMTEVIHYTSEDNNFIITNGREIFRYKPTNTIKDYLKNTLTNNMFFKLNKSNSINSLVPFIPHKDFRYPTNINKVMPPDLTLYEHYFNGANNLFTYNYKAFNINHMIKYDTSFKIMNFLGCAFNFDSVFNCLKSQDLFNVYRIPYNDTYKLFISNPTFDYMIAPIQ